MSTDAAIRRRMAIAHDRGSIAARILQRVEQQANGGCWVWLASLDSKGYGRFCYKGRTIPAHRAAYLVFVGEIEDGLFVLHQCDNKQCVNPRHLRLGTHADNMREARERKRMRAPNRILTDDAVIAIRAAYRGVDGEQVLLAERYGVNHSTIASIVNGHSYQHLYVRQPPAPPTQGDLFAGVLCSLSTKRPRGAQHHKAKLTAELVRQLRAEASAGVPRSALAQKFGIGKAQVSAILNWRYWRHA